MKIKTTKHFLLSLCLMTLTLLCGGNKAWGQATATLTFGTNNVKINADNVSTTDTQGNTWTITTVATASFIQKPTYSQVGSSNKPATSITFTTTLPSQSTITDFSAKFGGFSGTQGTISLKVDDTKVGSGSLNGTNDVTVNNTSSQLGQKLTITITGIAKGVKCYNISVTYQASTSTPAPTFSLKEGTYNGPLHVTITAPDGYTEGIAYTTDGTDPTTSGTAKDYSDAGIDINTTTTLRAVAYDSEMNFSGEAKATYPITYNAPTFSLAGGTYYGVQNVSISVEDLGSGSILYTTDGTDPKTNGTEYTEAISLPVGTNLTLKAFAKYGEGLFSEVTEVTYDTKEMGNESITFTGTEGAFDNLGGSSYKTGTYTFTDDNKNNHSFTVTDAMKRNSGLQLKASSGKAVSPIYESPYGYVITVTTSTNNVNLSSGFYSARGTNGSVELEIPETSASFTISTGSSYAVVSSITITPKTSNLTPTELSFPKSSISLGRVNNFTGQQATLMSKDVELKNKSLTYTSSNEAVATVDNNGSVTLIGFGETTITAEFAGDEKYSASSASYTLTYLDGKNNTTLSFEQTNYKVKFGNSFEAPIPTLSSNDVPLGEKTFSYESSAPAVATVNENGIVTLTGIGVTTITATFAGDEDYNGSSASYTLTVKDPKNLSVTFIFNQPEKYGYSEPTSGKYTVIGEGNTILSDEVTITNTKNGGASTRFHNSIGIITLRAYINAKLTISVPAGYFINSIEIIGSEGEYSLGDKTTTNGSISWNGSAQAVTLNNVTAKSFLETMTVNYKQLTFSDTEDLTASLPGTPLADQTVTLDRKVYSGWNTFCVPFALTQAQLEEAYGSGAVAKYLSDVTTDGAAATLHFTPEAEGGIKANKAYLLYLTADVTEAKTFSGVTLQPAGDCTTTVPTAGGDYTFQGILAPTALKTDDTQYFLNNAGTDFVLPLNNTSKLKATRAYIIVPAPAGPAQGRRYSFNFNGTTTAIDKVTVSGMEDGTWYTISGIRINRPAAKGVYIHNGRKVIVK